MQNLEHTYYLIAIAFSVYLLTSYVFSIIKVQNIQKALSSRQGLQLLNLRHLLGIVIFGLLFYVTNQEYRELINIDFNQNIGAIIIFMVIMGLTYAVALASVRKKVKTILKSSSATLNQGFLYFIIRTLFLFSYEFFFRGVLLFTLIASTTLITAILICTLLYMLIHAFDSKAEIIGALPFGIILCLLTYYTGNIWAAFVLHVILSGVYEVTMFKKLTFKNRRQ